MFFKSSHAYFLFLFDHTARFFTLSTLNSFSSQRKKNSSTSTYTITLNFRRTPYPARLPKSPILLLSTNTSTSRNNKTLRLFHARRYESFPTGSAQRPSEPLRKVTPHNHQRVSGAMHFGQHRFPTSFRRTTTQHVTARTTEEATDDGRSVSNVTCCVLERGHTTRVIGK